ncbi:MAG TPA: hypothetical protein VGB04_01105 [Allosphingosinicella sp.]
MLCLGVTCLGAAPLEAAGSASGEASFSVGGVEFRLPLPSGYCLPRGQQADVARLVAAGDTANATHLTLFPCDAAVDASGLGDQKDYILIKTPKQALNAQVTREELLLGLGEAFESPAFAQALASGQLLKEAGKGVSNVAGRTVDLSGNVAPRGKDELCAYLGGVMAVASSVKSYTLAVGTCITAVGGRVLSVYWYGSDERPTGVARLLVKTKGLAQTITSRTGR